MAASSSAFLPSLVAAASIPAFSPSHQSGPSPGGFDSNASTSPGEGGTPSSSFFSSNRPHYGTVASSFRPPLPPATSASFLPPIQPAPPRPSHSSSSTTAPTRTGGATFLSDEDDSTSEAGGGSTSAAVGAYAGTGTATPQGLQAIAPAPAGGRKPRAASVASSSGGNASSTTKGKGKGRAADSDGTPGPPGSATATAAAGKGKGKKGGGKRGQQVGPDGKPVPKKKKAGRACAACQKAHLTCDDARPCARCIKKGCPEECVDGARKKAKYLQEIPDELLERGRQAGGPSGTPGPSNGNAPQLAPDTSFLDSTLDSAMSDVGSHHQPSAPLAQGDAQPFFDFGTSLSQPTSAIPASAPGPYDPTSFLSFAPAAPAVSQPQQQQQPAPAVADATQFGSEAAGYEYAILNAMLNGNGFALDTHTTPALSGFGASGGGAGGGPSGPEPGSAGGASRQPDPMLLDGGDNAQQQRQQQQQAPQQGPSRAAFSSSPQPGGLLTAEEAYRSVTKPYPYAQSYHFLVKHLKERFEKNDILRIIRALATFRPSLIALQMPLTEEDETFVERTFQRTLVELNKLISFSGTPTVVWRRTGEICLVGTEFCLLTGWKREDLVGKKYIFELFDTASVVEYYESFAKHAFESTATSITMQCVVLAPDGRPVPCAFCFSVRRDLFSCPFLVIGSFLPVLV
ncbi:hypothetical protein JCM3775_004279 [Rhodotorula graminis]